MFSRFMRIAAIYTAILSIVVPAQAEWVYEQKSGKLTLDGKEVAKGYSGHGEGLNNPEKEAVRNVGPIPRGKWKIGDKFDHPSKGPVVMRLMPDGHDAHGRDGFLIHGDNKKGDMSASEGCIIFPRKVRDQIAEHADKNLSSSKH